MPAFDAVMMISRYEGLSYVLLESLAAQILIITTDVAGAEDGIGTRQCDAIVADDDHVAGRLDDAAMDIATDARWRGTMASTASARSHEVNECA